MQIRKLSKRGDSYEVVIPIEIARQWKRAGVVAVTIEWSPPHLLIAPLTLERMQYLRTRGITEEAPHADRDDQS